MYQIVLGQYVERKRTALGMSQETAAKNAGIHQSFWSRVERGELEDIKITTLMKIARALQVPVTTLSNICATGQIDETIEEIEPLPTVDSSTLLIPARVTHRQYNILQRLINAVIHNVDSIPDSEMMTDTSQKRGKKDMQEEERALKKPEVDELARQFFDEQPAGSAFKRDKRALNGGQTFDMPAEQEHEESQETTNKRDKRKKR